MLDLKALRNKVLARVIAMSPTEDIIFNAVAWHAEDVQFEEEGTTRYVIKAFGVTQHGSSVSVTIKGFTPYCYIKVPDRWSSQDITRLREYVSSQLHPKAFEEIASFTICMKKDFWGFTNGKKERFIRYCCWTHNTMRRLTSIISKGIAMPGTSRQTLTYLKLYESNIDPYLRFMHMQNLEPSGWIRIASKNARRNGDTLVTRARMDIECNWKALEPVASTSIAPLKVASFDIECASYSGEFPVARVTDHRRLARDLYNLYAKLQAQKIKSVQTVMDRIATATAGAFGDGPPVDGITRYRIAQNNIDGQRVRSKANEVVESLVSALRKDSRDDAIAAAVAVLEKARFPLPLGDEIIQIGTTVHRYGERECSSRFIAVLGSCDPVKGATVVACETEKDVLLAWGRFMRDIDADVITGYNIFGFDMSYINDRAEELGIKQDLYALLSRIEDRPATYVVKRLSSSALGDNELKVIAMPGRVSFDVMKVVQRDHKLDSYKLDHVAEHFTGERKHDVSPADIVVLQAGSSSDRAKIAAYCVQDCALCNKLCIKLETIANNIGMSNVCNVPLEFIFMRGQGIKIFSLVLKQCREDGFVIPVVKAASYGGPDAAGLEVEDDSYEGAIVLDPKEGIYIDDPVSVLDYASLYPSSMISENLSHDRLVMDARFDNLDGVSYHNISYDVYDDSKNKIGERVCRYALGEEGVLPRILLKLVGQRKATRKRIDIKEVRMADGRVLVGYFNEKTRVLVTDGGDEYCVSDADQVSDQYNAFQKAVLDGLQLAYKVTANSLYGQMGARTSPLYLKDIAACTTATGRNMIMKAKAFLESNYNANIIYGDTDSLFCCFDNRDPATGMKLKGKEALAASIATAKEASKEFKKIIKPPHDLEYEKTFLPFLLFSRKRYAGLKYECDVNKCKQTYMGIVLRRRDNANIVKKIYGGILDIVLYESDIPKSIAFLKNSISDLRKGNCPIDDLVITKSLRADYKDPDKIAHKVLAERMGERDPGNKPQVNDRIPFVYIAMPGAKKVLQGERIEHPDFVKAKRLKVDYDFYITNQIMRPVCQLYSVMWEKIPGFRRVGGAPLDYNVQYKKLSKEIGAAKAKDKVDAMKERDIEQFMFGDVIVAMNNARERNCPITRFFPPQGSVATK